MRRRAPLLALWIAGAAAAVLGYALLDEPTLAAVLTRSVGPSFLVCGLIAWQRRPDAGTGPLMVLTGGLFLAGQLLSEAGGSFASTLGDAVANA